MKKQETTVTIERRELRLTSLDKVLYPEVGFTKGQVIDYYVRIAPVLLPHLKDRPLTLKRYPNGVDQEFFYEKRAPKYRPAWLKTAAVPSAHDPSGKIDYCLANDLPSLVWAANLADLELHPFLARRQEVERPTQIMFDLDPGPPADATDCAEVALWIREAMEKLGLRCFIKSSGSKGLQIHIPLNTPTSYAITKPFARAFAVAMQEAHPDRVVYDMKKTLRGGKVLIDWSQNDSSKTTICVYSLRARPHPFVAAPLTWEEVETCRRKDDPQSVFFESETVLQRVDKMGDLFAEVLTLKQKLPKNAAETVGDHLRSGPKKKSTKALARYEAKRNFRQTTEPRGAKKISDPSLFVIQKHDASRLHYDFRLALDGVLKSWAVPKGIPTRKGEKHLAVEVEDHPMDYAGFEGIIPEGNYGGGTVMVWDTGTWRLLGGTPRDAHREGRMHFELKGKKLNGEWTLIRMNRGHSDKNEWLLLKSGESVPDISASADDRSALTGRSLAQIARARDATWQSNRPDKKKPEESPRKKSTPPKRNTSHLAARFVEPMKCLPRDKMPAGPEWLYELKFDGYRSLAIVRQGNALLLSRNKKPLNERFPDLAAEMGKLPVKEAVLDGEIVALDAENRPSFQLLQNYEQGPPLLYYLFDLLSVDGEDLTGSPLEERKARLEKLLAGVSPRLLFSGELPGSAAKIWKTIQRQGLEGIVAKRRDSPYEAGRRSGQWVKIKAINQQDFVIGGFSKPKGGRTHFGALLVGVFEKKGLRFCGKVGTGFNRKVLTELHGAMKKLETGKCPFFNLPVPRHNRWGGGVTASEMRQCSWIEPRLVCEVRFTEWTGDGSLRHPAYTGLRDDIDPAQVHRENS